MQPIVDAKGLTKEYWIESDGFSRKKKRFLAVDHVDLTIYPGEIVGLIGESGSGKSTLGKLIMGLEKPTHGQLWFQGQDITDLKHKDRISFYKRAQMIFQDSTSSLNPRKSIGEQLIVPMLRLGVADSRLAAEKKLLQLLERVGLKKDHLERFPHEFSGGQRQRIGIARALAVEPEFIVLDEPTSALDVSIQAQILNLLMDLRDEFQLTYLFIGHNLAIIQYLCSRVAVMDKGRLLEVFKSEELFSQDRHAVTQTLVDSVLTAERRPDYDRQPIL